MNIDYLHKRFGTVKGESSPIFGKHKDRNIITREVLAEIFHEFGFTVGAEIGVYRGEYSEVLLNKNPHLKLYLIDPWMGWAHANEGVQRKNFRLARQRLVDRNVEYIVKPSLIAADDIPDGSLDFVYIDAAHDFDNVMLDLIMWGKKVRKGGIISGHDYYYHYTVGVLTAVDTYAKAHGVSQWFATKDYPPSFLWIKE